MGQAAVVLDNPGLIQYVFALNPDSPELARSEAGFRAELLAELRRYWEQATAGWRAHPLFQNVPGQADVGHGFPQRLAAPHGQIMLAAAQLEHPTAAHQGFILL